MARRSESRRSSSRNWKPGWNLRDSSSPKRVPLIAPLLESAAAGEVSAVTAVARAAAPAACWPRWSSGRWAPPERSRLVIAIEDLHWADPSTLELTATAGRAGGDGATVAAVHGAARVSRPVAVSGRITRKSRSTG